MSSVVPEDLTPYIPGFPTVTTRIIYGQWIYTDGSGITTPPTITYLGGPYYLTPGRVTIFPKQQTANLSQSAGNGTAGVWWSEVIVLDDPDLVGNVSVRISHPILPGGAITIAVPSGTDPLNVSNALQVTGAAGGLLVIAGKSAYEIAVDHGFVGTETQWLASLQGSGSGGTGGALTDGSVTTVKLADASVTSAKIVDGSIATADIADGAITSAKILDATIATGDLANLAVTTAKIADGAVTSTKVGGGTTGKAILANETALDVFTTLGITNGVVFQANTDSARRTVPSGYQLFIIGGTTPPTWMLTNDIQLATA